MSVDKKLSWVEVESKSRPGRSYFYNRVTKTSTWERPPDFPEADVPAHLVKAKPVPVGDSTQDRTPDIAWAPKRTTARQKVVSAKTADSLIPKESSLTLSSPPAAGKKGLLSSTVKRAHSHPSSLLKKMNDVAMPMEVSAEVVKLKTKLEKRKSSGAREEAMEVERWGEEEEVAMDVDVSEADMAAMKAVRENLPPSSNLDLGAFGVPRDYTNDYSENIYLVLDTNVLLSHLHFLEELKDYAIKGVGKPVLVIPWVVMEELDNHKLVGKGRLSTKARSAIRFLFTSFSQRHARVRCQTMEEVHTEIHNMAIKNNDDRVLHCSLLYQLKTKDHNGIVVLFSNDLNLCAKAMGNQVMAADRTTLFKELRAICQRVPRQPPPSLPISLPPSVPSSIPTSLPLSLHPSPSPSLPLPLPYFSTMPPLTLIDQVSTIQSSASLTSYSDPRLEQRKTINGLMVEAEGVVRDTLAPLVEQEMAEAFDDLWMGMVAVKPPWSLKDILYLINKHWVAVFNIVLPHLAKSMATQLLHAVKTRPGSPSVEQAIAFVTKGIPLMNSFLERDNSRSIPQGVYMLNTIFKRLQQLKQPATSPNTAATSQPPIAHVAPLSLPPSSSTACSSTPLTPITPLPSSIPLEHMKQQLSQSVQAVPTDPAHCLQWVLRLIRNSIIYCQRTVHDTLDSSHSPLDRACASQFVQEITEMLSGIVTSLYSLLQLGLSIPRMQETLAAFDVFLTKVLLVTSPLTTEVFYDLASTPGQRLLLETALKNYSDLLSELQTMGSRLKV